jgi:hypothetical protein
MNELIQKLAEEAGLDVRTMGFENNQYQHDPWNARLSKFTQLITKECVQICDDTRKLTWSVPLKDDEQITACICMIKKNFGLQE